MPRFRPWSLAVLAVATLGLAGCSSGSSSSPTTSATPATTPATTAAPVATVPVQDPSPAGTLGTKPTVTVPPGAPPTQLQSTDLIVGTGPAAKAGDNVTVQYVLATYSSGKEIQASWDSQPFSFVLGEGNVITGWDQGVVGMKAGGRRELVIPPSLGYGANAPGPGIAANDTLVFIVDMVKIG
ncbi:MAG TPA: FKBP-type peptidyl-prolyl cis-trans isomerase [Acidimicrobiales bacterium]|jgi:peptidylprolyl isomerase